MKPISLKEAVKAVNGRLLNEKISPEVEIFIVGISIDSRKVSRGDMFVAIHGENMDGHDYIEMAFEKGATCVLSEKEIKTDYPVIFVESTRKAFMDLAEYYRSLFDIKTVAVTGSVGKTTTKDIIASVLMQKYNIIKTEGNFNNEIGLPLTVFNIEEQHEIAIFEMGMNNFNEIHKLSKIVKPDLAVITNIGVSHIENLGSREGILKAKCEIFDFMKQGGKAILNHDDDLLKTLDGNLNFDILFFGTKEFEKCALYANEIESLGLEGIKSNIETEMGTIKMQTDIPGSHMVTNALAAATVGSCLGLSLDKIAVGIKNFSPTNMRMNISKTKSGKTLINDAYNASPSSMEAAINVLVESKGKKAAILGDMFELGSFSAEYHEKLGIFASQKGIDVIICIGNFSQSTFRGAKKYGKENQTVVYFDTQEKFFDSLDLIGDSETILVKASRGMHFEKTVDKILG